VDFTVIAIGIAAVVIGGVAFAVLRARRR